MINKRKYGNPRRIYFRDHCRKSSILTLKHSITSKKGFMIEQDIGPAGFGEIIGAVD
jgi:hypothetical protein